MDGRSGQATWITIVCLPVFLIHALPLSAHPKMGRRDVLGIVVWVVGFVMEVMADHRESVCHGDSRCGMMGDDSQRRLDGGEIRT